LPRPTLAPREIAVEQVFQEADMIALRQVMQARDRIFRSIIRTPAVKSDFLSDITGANVYLKLECLQKLNSFKIRGALNRGLTLSESARSAGIVAASSGNHGAAVSYVANMLGIGADVFVPRGTPEVKLDKIRRYGAVLHLEGNSYDEAHALAVLHAKRSGKTYFDPASDEVAVAGHGTIGLELVEDVPTVDVVLVPVGGGGLITGIGVAARAVKPSVSVIGVQTEACPAMLAALRDKVFYEEYPSEPSVCDAVVGGIGKIGYEYAEKCIHSVVTASEDQVKEAVIELMRRDKIVAEPSGALGVAYLMGSGDRFRGMNVVVVISGGNIDFEFLAAEIRAYGDRN
jgi:threonine dehydratase